MCIEGFPQIQKLQQRFGADKLAVALIDVDPEYYRNQEQYLPKARQILERQKVDWPNALAVNGFNDVMHAFNVSGYSSIVVDAKGIVRGLNLHGKDLERVIEETMRGK